MASKRQKKLVDNYPRGVLTLNDSTSSKIEQIQMLAGGIIFKHIGQTKTTFVPYTGFKNILYDNVPQEIVDARANTAKANKPST